MKALLQKAVQLRNPIFKFDNDLDSLALLQFFWIQSMSVFRGLLIIFYFKKPKGLMLGRSVSFFNPCKIHWGKFLRLGNYVTVSALGKKGIWLGNNVSIGAFSRIIISTSLNDLGDRIVIGNNVGIGEYAYLGGAGGLEIGDDCIAGQYLSCHAENHNYGHRDILIRHQGVTRKGIRIGKNCWIGSKVTILDGVEIGDGCVIAAGSVVTKSFTENSIIGGVPAKLIKSRL